MIIAQSALPLMNLESKRIVLRADLNVPLDNGKILNDYRLTAILPTIDLILSRGGSIILMSHIGRPDKPTPHLSTKHLIPWFINHHYDIVFARSIEQAHELSKEKKASII